MNPSRVFCLSLAAIFTLACEREAAESMPASTTEPAIEQPAAPPARDFTALLASRSAEDLARDEARKPAEVISFLGIEPGMTVLDLLAAGGWYTEVLSLAVGPEGKVYAHNTELTLSFRDGANEKAISARLADNRLPNVERLDRELTDLGLAPGSIDAAMFALNFHDVYNAAGPEATQTVLAALFDVLKPGGMLAIIDHDGAAGADNKSLHRIERAKVIEAVEASPFVVDAESGVLHHPEDDLSLMVFDPAIRGKTHRFVLRLKKPA